MSANFTKKKWALESYEKRDHNTWKAVNINKQRCYLTLVHPQLLIEDNGVAVHSVDLSGGAGEIEVQYANNNIGIKTTDKNAKASKIRIRLANGSGNKTGSDYCNEVVDELKKCVPVIKHPSHIEREPKGIVKQELLEMVKVFLSETSNRPNINDFESIIPESQMKELIYAFVLHPQFPTKIVEMWEQFSKFK